MPGAYAHLTLVNELREPQRLEAVPGFPPDAIAALLDHFKFCELGAVSPDYPYLAIGDAGAKRWADTMHYTRTGQVIQAGVRRCLDLSGESRRKGLAWLLGFAAHVTTDVTMHPVVEMKVGPYQGNEKAHRICEMHQDAYVFQRMNLGQVGLSNYLDSGIATCHAADDPDLLDRDIVALWSGMLQDVHRNEFLRNPPDIDKWHKGFKFGIGEIASGGDHLFPIARHVAAGQGLVYPVREEIDGQFINGLATPSGKTMDYDSIFADAVRNVAGIWQAVASGVMQEQETYLSRIGDWNLDTGRDGQEMLVFWEMA
jgi:hypothetical protein